MPATRPRSVSADLSPTAKRQKPNPPPSSSTPTAADDPTTAFIPDLFAPLNVQKLAAAYEESEPYKHAVLDQLIDDQLLRKVKDEILGELRFAEKETDIYKVHQTGDLASLSYLPPAQLALFPSLLRLRNALYSPPFRQFLRRITGCGPLSGKKQDMSVNSYRQGCHLLNHDDVIGSRRVSYILYLPLAGDGEPGWDDSWGGALELYPVTQPEPGKLPEPEVKPSKRIPPAWNQFVFFEVQPGHSFHSVEEVVTPFTIGDTGGEEDPQELQKRGRQRLSVSGWFHVAQEGEEGWDEERSSGRTERLLSSLEQLSASDPPALTAYPTPPELFQPSTPLSETDLLHLSRFLNPIYLQPRSLLLLSQQFAADSSLNLRDFLRPALAEQLESVLREQDEQDGFAAEKRGGRIPRHESGSLPGWEVKGPPHKYRYLSLSATPTSSSAVSAPAQEPTPNPLLRSLQEELFPSPAFRAWLALITSLVPLSYRVESRRFRPGLDYTLAQSVEGEARLDVGLGLTPQPGGGASARNGNGKGKGKAVENGNGKGKGKAVENGNGKGKGKAVGDGKGKGKGKAKEEEPEEEQDDPANGWKSLDWGGWECYMAPDEGDADPAVYRSGGSRSADAGGGNGDTPDQNGEKEAVEQEEEDGEGGLEIAEEDREAYEEALAMEEADRLASHRNGSHTANGSTLPGADKQDEDVEAEDDSEEEDDDAADSGTLLTAPAAFNTLLLVLRDPGLMRFVKYVSARAGGCRWDVVGEWGVGELEEDEGEDDE